jgi:pimeloyl-ACP methyl ester carboxylesterase
MSRAYRDIWARSEDGLRLHARDYGEAGTSTPPIVCLSGLSRHAGEFHDLALALTAERPRRVVAIDYRGRGQSDHDPDPANYNVQVEAADLLRVLAEAGISRAIFVGTSRGGLITMGLATAKPEMIMGAVLNDIGPVIEREGLLRIKTYVGRMQAPRDIAHATAIVKELFGPQFPKLPDEAWRAWAENTWEQREGGFVLTYDPALARTLDPIGPESDIPAIWPLFEALGRVPVLVIRGGLSDLLSADTAAEMRARHPDCEVLTVPDEGHSPILTRPDCLAAIGALIGRAEAQAQR